MSLYFSKMERLRISIIKHKHGAKITFGTFGLSIDGHQIQLIC
jgi:hypothetical protein